MFRHFLIPLDGSRLAEAALPPAAWLARALNATVTLAHFIERDAPAAVHGERHLTNPAEATRYLGDVAQHFFGKEADILFHVHSAEVKNVAESIVDHAGEFGADLVVMCAHGKRGLKRLIEGSIAQRVIGTGRCPVLLLHPDAPPEKGFSRIMVPIDGDPEHEKALRLADELAAAIGAHLHLLSVVPTLRTLAGGEAATGIMLPAATSELLAMSEASARTHLAELAHSRAEGALPGTIAVRRGDPAAQIVAEADEQHIDLIVIASHGKAGMNAFWSGSVAPHIPTMTHLPLLLVPAHHS